MREPNDDLIFDLSECGGNAHSILGGVKTALMRAGADEEYCEKFYAEATEDDYDHLIQTAMKYTGDV